MNHSLIVLKDLYCRTLYDVIPKRSNITGISDVTEFWIPILETDWIYNVWLVVNGLYVSKTEEPLTRACDYYNPENTYSIFYAEYQFKKPRKNVEVHWVYEITGKKYVSPSMYFDVEDY